MIVTIAKIYNTTIQNAEYIAKPGYPYCFPHMYRMFPKQKQIVTIVINLGITIQTFVQHNIRKPRTYMADKIMLEQQYHNIMIRTEHHLDKFNCG